MTVAALSYISRELLDPGWSFDLQAFKTLPAADQKAITTRVAQLKAESVAFSGTYTPVLTNKLTDPDASGTARSGTASLALAGSSGRPVAGVTFKATITGNARFTNGVRTAAAGAASDQTVSGQTRATAIPLPWAGTVQAKNGDKVSINGSFSGIPAAAYYEYDAPHAGEQRVIGAAPARSAAATSPAVAITIARPVATTRVATSTWRLSLIHI